jgi:hypothetical protein
MLAAEFNLPDRHAHKFFTAFLSIDILVRSPRRTAVTLGANDRKRCCKCLTHDYVDSSGTVLFPFTSLSIFHLRIIDAWVNIVPCSVRRIDLGHTVYLFAPWMGSTGESTNEDNLNFKKKKKLLMNALRARTEVQLFKTHTRKHEKGESY